MAGNPLPTAAATLTALHARSDDEWAAATVALPRELAAIRSLLHPASFSPERCRLWADALLQLWRERVVPADFAFFAQEVSDRISAYADDGCRSLLACAAVEAGVLEQLASDLSSAWDTPREWYAMLAGVQRYIRPFRIVPPELRGPHAVDLVVRLMHVIKFFPASDAAYSPYLPGLVRSLRFLCVRSEALKVVIYRQGVVQVAHSLISSENRQVSKEGLRLMTLFTCNELILAVQRNFVEHLMHSWPAVGEPAWVAG